MPDSIGGQLESSIIIEDGEVLVIREEIIAPPGEPAVEIPGEDARLRVTSDGSIIADDAGNTAVTTSGEEVRIDNFGTISGAFNGVSSTSDGFTLSNAGTITSDSRAVDLVEGDDIFVRNVGDILGTGDQRNGTLYVNGLIDDATIINTGNGVIDAGEGNSGDGISVQVGAAAEDSINENINIINRGAIAGRGQAEFDGGRLTANGSSGVRFFNGSGEAEATITGTFTNFSDITSEVDVGFLGGFVIEDGVAFEGTINNQRSGSISGPRNGLYVGNADHDLTINNRGLIESGSRAVNLDGDNVTLDNTGEILGTGDQRNGTVYIDGTGDDITIENNRSGIIDAGEGNIGDGISVQVGAAAEDAISENINIINRGVIAGRGQAEFDGGRLTANGSSGLRFFNGSGEAEAIVTGSITNSGDITSEVDVGFLGGLVVEDGVAFEGTIDNLRTGFITGPRNGLYIGNADHDLEIDNKGLIESGSRAVNLDGDNVFLENSGDILGTGDQRNGTVYVDGTGDNIIIDNDRRGVIDAGEGNSGSGVSVQVGAANGFGDGLDDVETIVDIFNDGTIQGRGDANVPAGVRLFVGSGLAEATFTGNITNESRGVIASEEEAGILIEEGVIFNGEIINDGTIIGGNGLAVDATGALGSIVFNNDGTLEGAVRLGEGDDTFVQGYSQAVEVTGGLGNDTITGDDGSDTVRYDDLDIGVSVNLETGIAQREVGGVIETDTLTNIENVVGSSGADELIGDSQDNILVGLGGGDTLFGEGGDDFLQGGGGSDFVFGGAGFDTISFADINAEVTITLEGEDSGFAQYIVNGNVVTDTFSGIEAVDFGDGAISIAEFASDFV